MTCPLHACEHLHSCLHLTNLCAKWKVLSLTKPEGKIYKTKFLSHYITSGAIQRKGVAPFSTPWCSSYWKESLLVTLDYGRQLFLLLISISSSSSSCHVASTDFLWPSLTICLYRPLLLVGLLRPHPVSVQSCCR